MNYNDGGCDVGCPVKVDLAVSFCYNEFYSICPGIIYNCGYTGSLFRRSTAVFCTEEQEEDKMITTTTGYIDGKSVEEYKGIVFGEVITGVNLLKDFAAGVRNIFGGRSQSYENELLNAREEALREMEERAAQLGANAVIGVDIDYEVLGADNGMLMVTASGTAVVIR